MSSPVTLAATRPLRFIITGAGRGLGRGLARTLLVAGHDVYLLDNDSAELKHTLETHLPSAREEFKKGRFGGTTCDVTDPRSVQAALAQARQFHREEMCDVLVNNAAKTFPYWKSIESLSKPYPGTSDKKTVDALDPKIDPTADPALAEWQAFVSTNLTGAFLVTRLCLGMLQRRTDANDEKDGISPSVIFISSTRAIQSEPNHEGYASTKAGLLGLSHALASSLSPIGVRSNAILPGWFPSGHESSEGDAKGQTWTQDLTEADQSQHWSGRVGRIEDLSNAVLYLSTTRFVNGAQICLDGGMTRKMQYEE